MRHCEWWKLHNYSVDELSHASCGELMGPEEFYAFHYRNVGIGGASIS